MTDATVIGWALRTPLGATVDEVVAHLLAVHRADGDRARISTHLAASSSFGFGGRNASLVLARPS